MKLIIIFLISNVFFALTANAGVLDILGVSSNVNKPEIWQDQLSGYASGGSIYVRAPSNNLQIVSVNMPSFDMGCGGIDINFGGLGYVNGEQIIELLKNIGSSTISYSALLAIKSVSPQIADLLETIESMTRFANSMNINSCQMGAAIAGGSFSKTEAGQRLACQARQMGTGVGSNLSNAFTAHVNCNKQDAMRKNNQDEQSSLLPSEYNLVWYALDKHAQGLDAIDRELLMSISGTVIQKNGTFEHKGSLLKDGKILEGIIFGDKQIRSESYSCDEQKQCLTLSKIKKVYDKPIIEQIRSLLESMSEKFIKETKDNQQKLSDQEKDLVSKTSIPILKMISSNVAYRGDKATHAIMDYAESIAFDYVIGYLDSLMDIVYLAISNLEHAQIEGIAIKNFKDELKDIRRILYQERSIVLDRLNTLLSVKKRAEYISGLVAESFGGYRKTDRLDNKL